MSFSLMPVDKVDHLISTQEFLVLYVKGTGTESVHSRTKRNRSRSHVPVLDRTGLNSLGCARPHPSTPFYKHNGGDIFRLNNLVQQKLCQALSC